jgi:hypothetical protein
MSPIFSHTASSREATTVSTSVQELMHANLFEVFNERDRDKRSEAIARTYTEDVVFHDPQDVVVGRPALDAKAQEVLDDAPGFVFRAEGPVRENHDLGMLAWELGPEGGPAVVAGLDVALVRDGRIASLYTILTATPAG